MDDKIKKLLDDDSWTEEEREKLRQYVSNEDASTEAKTTPEPSQDKKNVADQEQPSPAKEAPEQKEDEQKRQHVGKDINVGDFLQNKISKSSGRDILETVRGEIAGKVDHLVINNYGTREPTGKLRSKTPILPDDTIQPPTTVEDLETWFSGKTDEAETTKPKYGQLVEDRLRYFVVTLTLFNGLKWVDFWQVYQAVLQYKGLHKPTKAETEHPLSHFEYSDTKLTRLTYSQIMIEKFEQELGFSSQTIVEFKNADALADQNKTFHQLVTQYLFTNYRALLMSLVPLLKKLGENDNWEIRTRSAQAVGELAKIDFGTIYQDIIRPWATDKRPFVRAAVGYVLDKLICDQEHDADAKSVLQFWSNPERDIPWRYPWTATAAYKQIGLTHIELALQGLKPLAKNTDIDVMNATVYALVVLTVSGKIREVVLTLKAWSEEDNQPETVYAVSFLVFITLASLNEEERAVISTLEETSLSQTDSPETKDNQLMLETLLSNDEQDGINTALVSILLRMCKQGLTTIVFDVLRWWLIMANDTAMMSDVVVQTVLTLYHRLGSKGKTIILNNILTKKWQQDSETVVQTVEQRLQYQIMNRSDANKTASVPPQPSTEPTIVFGE